MASVTKAKIFNNPQDHVILAEKTSFPAFKGGWDQHALYLKKSKWTRNERDQLDLHLQKMGYRIVVSPFDTKEEYKILENVLNPNFIDLGLKQSAEKWGFEFTAIADNKPFPFDVKIKNQSFFNIVFIILVIMAFAVAALLLKVFKKDKLLALKNQAAPAFICGLLGASTQIYLIYKILLFTGLPSLALNIGVGLSLLTSALVFWWSSKFRATQKQLLLIGLLDLILLILFALVFECWPEILFKTNYFGLLLFLAIASFGFVGFASLLFSFLINEKSNRSEIIGIDAVGGFLAALIIPILIEYWGINLSIAISITCLLLLIGILFTSLKNTNAT